MFNHLKLIPFLDKFAISITTICAFHCLLLPVFLALFPTISSTLLGDEIFHKFLLFVIIPSSLIGLSLGCKKHKSLFVALMGLLGLTALIMAAFLDHDLVGEDGERILVVLGGVAIAFGHLKNFSLCRNLNS